MRNGSHIFQELGRNKNNPEQLDDSEVRQLFRSTLYQIKAATESALDSTITIMSVVGTENNHGTTSHSLLAKIAVEEGFVSAGHQVTPALNGARLAYNLDSCEGFGLESGLECDLEDDHFVLVVTYDQTRLSMAMLGVQLYTLQPYNITHYEQYGQDSGSILDPERQNDLSVDLKVYLEAFTKEMQSSWDISEALKNLRAIILRGEASSSSMEEMRQALTTALSEYQYKLRMTLNPHYIGAFGAAQRARHIVQNRLFLNSGVFVSPPIGYLDEFHEEL